MTIATRQLIDSHLDRLRTEAERVVMETEHLALGLNERQLIWRPAPDAWSIAHCFDHLVVVGNLYYPRTRAAIDEASRQGRRAPHDSFRATLFGRLFVHTSGPITRIKIRTRDIFAPAAHPSPTSFATFIRQQETLLGLIQDADGLDLRAIRIHSPLSRLLTLRLGECLEMLVAHQQRHLTQARHVTEAAGFPA